MRATSVLLLLAALAGVALSCSRCDSDMCCDIPSDNQYFLTDFCDGPGTMACGESCGFTTYYTADRQRFGCGKNLHICGYGKCVTAVVADAGPAYWVEEDAGGPIIDASPQLCRYITGAGSCGWSDHFRITAVVTTDSAAPGPFRPSPQEYMRIVGKDFYEREVAAGLYKPDLSAPICCTPNQYQGFSFSWDAEQGWRSGMNISYDYTNQRISTRIFQRDERGESRVLESIVLFGSKQAYTIDWTTETCRIDSITHTMEQDCVPTSATLEGEATVGGSLPVYLIHSTGPEGDIHESRATANCFPVESSVINPGGAVSTSYLDFTIGIKNQTIFSPPSFCHQSGESLQHNSLTKLLTSLPGPASLRRSMAAVRKLIKEEM